MIQPAELLSRLEADEPIAQNYRWEEKVGAARRAAYQDSLPDTLPDLTAWSDAHTNRWLKNRITHVALPETFTASNAAAALNGPILAPDNQGQELVRIECLDYYIEENPIHDLNSLLHQIEVCQGRVTDRHFTRGDAEESLETLCEALNLSPYARSPRFAAFAQELQEDIEQPDWALRLRDRLGLGHYRPTLRFPTRTLALMRYTVKDVVAAANRAGAAHAMTAPTGLDADLNEFFFPAPRDLDYGRTVNLAGADTLAAEVLHLRIPYRAKNLWKVGIVTTPPEKDIRRLRENHLSCVRLESGRDDFGRA